MNRSKIVPTLIVSGFMTYVPVGRFNVPWIPGFFLCGRLETKGGCIHNVHIHTCRYIDT